VDREDKDREGDGGAVQVRGGKREGEGDVVCSMRGIPIFLKLFQFYPKFSGYVIN
jgi:hypothetical protein